MSPTLNLMFCIVKVYQVKQPRTNPKCLTEYRIWQQNTLPDPIFPDNGNVSIVFGNKIYKYMSVGDSQDQ